MHSPPQVQARMLPVSDHQKANLRPATLVQATGRTGLKRPIQANRLRAWSCVNSTNHCHRRCAADKQVASQGTQRYNCEGRYSSRPMSSLIRRSPLIRRAAEEAFQFITGLVAAVSTVGDAARHDTGTDLTLRAVATQSLAVAWSLPASGHPHLEILPTGILMCYGMISRGRSGRL
jgi:hypothetical protein